LKQLFEAASRRGSVDEQETDLLDYLRIIWRRRRMILILCVVAMTLTVIVSRTKPRFYQASITIVPPLDVLQKGSSVDQLSGLGSSMLRGIMDSGSISGMYVEILQSREVADSIIGRFRLMDIYEDIRYRSQARRILQENTKIQTTDDGAVKVAIKDTDPNRAAAIANAYVEELDRQNKRLSSGQATSKRLFLETRLKEVEAKLSRIETIPAREAQVQEMLYELLIRELELAKIEEARSMPTIQVVDKAEVPELPMARGTVRKGMLAGIAAMMFGTFLAFGREYLGQTREAGLAKQFERATRRRKVASDSGVDQSGGDGVPGAKNLVAKP
jgi:tyrosine-protein kinase Etk/Wzc